MVKSSRYKTELELKKLIGIDKFYLELTPCLVWMQWLESI